MPLDVFPICIVLNPTNSERSNIIWRFRGGGSQTVRGLSYGRGRLAWHWL